MLPAKKFEFCGSWAMMSPALDRLSFWISTSLITVTGFGVVKVDRTMREPVITTSWTCPALAELALEPLSAAQAVPAPRTAIDRAAALAPASRRVLADRFSADCWSRRMAPPSQAVVSIPGGALERAPFGRVRRPF